MSFEFRGTHNSRLITHDLTVQGANMRNPVNVGRP
jgi:hypothetical protein